ncbi:MAG: methyltransferase domain-containing protein [Candidatus Methylumidiphilus sp.]
MTNHFDTIADIYNKVWYFSGQYQKSMLENIIELLQLGKDDVLADIGGGTGATTRLLLETSNLRKAYCIEPSRKMFLEAQKIPVIESVCADADGFMQLEIDFSKALLKEVVHHIPSREVLWRYLRDKLPAQGRILIVTRPQAIALPLFEKAKQAFRQKQPKHEVLMQELETSGFATSYRVHPYRFTLDKAVWFDMIRNRFMSDLAGFTDGEIEEGLIEIDGNYPGGTIEIPDNIIYIPASIKG